MESEQNRIEQVAACFALQLQLLSSDGISSENDVDTKVYIRQFASCLADKGVDPMEQDELLKAFRLAGKKWKSMEKKAIPSTPVETGSFSLLDQLQGGFALPVPIDEIKEAQSEHERLALLRKISYVDDLLPDWAEFRSLLKECLQGPNETAIEYLGIHRKFFDLCRSSSEYDSIAYNLCQNLMDATTASIMDESSTFETEYSVSLIESWRDMFLDLMQRDKYAQVDAMESEVFSLLGTTSRQKNSILPFHVLALADPFATWFQSWIQHVTPKHLVNLLATNAGSLSGIVAWSQLDATEASEMRPGILAGRMQAVAILSHIVCKTRVTLFPWNMLSSDTSGPAESLKVAAAEEEGDCQIALQNPRKANLELMVSLFLRAVSFDERDGWKFIFYNAVETLLWGFVSLDVDAADTLSTVHEHIHAITSVSARAACLARLQEVTALLE